MKVVTFGELMLRLTPPSFDRFNQTGRFEANFGGSEANVAVSLANFGVESEFVTALSPNRLSDAALDDLHRYGVVTDRVVRKAGRMGLYYMEEAVAMRSSQVVYDREGSSFANLEKGDIDWDAAFADADWFHWSGIAPAVGKGAAEVCAEAIAAARRRGLVISCDINYRRNLWKWGARPHEVLPAMMAECDILFGTELEFQQALGVEMPQFKAVDTEYEMAMEAYTRAAEEVSRQMPRCHTIVFALRNVINAQHHLLGGTMWHRGEMYRARIFDIEGVVDCVGVGDAYNAGIIYGMLHQVDMQRALDLGAAACALKNTVPGDYGQFPIEEIEAAADGATNGRIAR
ncbi:MAG: sugar kinase [Alistipes sp.]|nr:sugar kinase [Alistipes sp.]